MLNGTMNADITGGVPWTSAEAGWRHKLTINATDASLAGTNGRMLCKLHIDGTLDVLQSSLAEAGFLVRTWRNGAPTCNSPSAGQRNFSSVTEGSRSSTPPSPLLDHQPVSSGITIGVSFVFGTQLDLGVYALAYFMGSAGVVQGTTNFSDTRRWSGVPSLLRQSDSQPGCHRKSDRSSQFASTQSPLRISSIRKAVRSSPR